VTAAVIRTAIKEKHCTLRGGSFWVTIILDRKRMQGFASWERRAV
jgi:hypothetical protein